MHYVYVLRSEAPAPGFYIGATSDLRKRVAGHEAGDTHSTRGRRWRLVYYEAYLTREAAFDRERKLKHDGRTRRVLMDRLKAHLS